MLEHCASGRRKPLPNIHALKEQVRLALVCRVDRRSLLRAADDAGRALRLPCSAKTLIGVLASCFGEQKLSQGLMVWPSNEYLEARTGRSERSLRNAIARLRREGLVLMVDSPNGKRFARRQGNSVIHAFGFNLAPLYARRENFGRTVAEAEAHVKFCKELRHDINAARKDIGDIVAGLNDLGRHDLSAPFVALMAETAPPRSRSTPSDDLEEILVKAESGRTRAEKTFYLAARPTKKTGYGGKNGRHIESNTESSIENCKTCPSEERRKREPHPNSALPEIGAEQDDWRANCNDTFKRAGEPLLDADLWRAACPTLSDFGEVRTMTDVTRTGTAMVRLLQVAPHGIERWHKSLGPKLPLVAAYVYQLYADDQARKHPEIRKPGGFFCYVAKEVADGERDLSVDLMAMLRKRQRSMAS